MAAMSKTNTVARSLNDLGLAAWFGGSLMGAVGLNEAGARAARPTEVTAVAGRGWSAWTPINLAAIGAHLTGGLALTFANKGRLLGQKGVATETLARTGLTLGALGLTGYARFLGQKVIANPEQPSEAGTEPTAATSDDVAAAQRQLRVLQWAIPALTGTLVVLNARMGEQQRPGSVVSGVLRRVHD